MESDDKNEWSGAIQKELTELSERGTWELVPRPRNTRILPCKLILKVKRHADGTIDKFKARLVLGCMQRDGDYNETFSPVIDFTTIRLALTLANMNGAEVHHLDITGSFLYGSLEDELYMSYPKGFEKQGQTDHVCKLK
jgi:Reverse transcriptase (RNA-dependent DNA polymerase)